MLNHVSTADQDKQNTGSRLGVSFSFSFRNRRASGGGHKRITRCLLNATHWSFKSNLKSCGVKGATSGISLRFWLNLRISPDTKKSFKIDILTLSVAVQRWRKMLSLVLVEVRFRKTLIWAISHGRSCPLQHWLMLISLYSCINLTLTHPGRRFYSSSFLQFLLQL